MSEQDRSLRAALAEVLPGAPGTALASRMHLEAGIGLDSAWAALRGRRISPENARRIADWAWTRYGIVVDRLALIEAAPASRGA